MLCDDNLCYIHRNLGEEALSITGRVYPRHVIHTGEYQFRTLSMTCPLAVGVALFSRNGMELQQVIGGEDTGAWQLAAKCGEQKDIDNDLMAVHIIMGGLSILQNVSYSFEQRLVLLGLFLDRVEDCQQDLEAVADLIDYYNSDEFQVYGIIGNIIQQHISSFWRAYLRLWKKKAN